MKNSKLLCALLGFFLGFFVQGQSLVELQEIALANNAGIQASYKQFEASLEQIPQAKSLDDPILSGGYFLQPMGTLMGEQVFKLSLNQQFPWFGTLKAKGDLVALQTEANFQDFIEQKANLELRIAEVYFPLLEIHQLMELEKKHQKLLNSIYEVAENQYENNEVSLKDVYEVEMELEESKINLQILHQQKKAKEARINALLNRSENIAIKPVPDLINEANDEVEKSVENHPALEAINLKTSAYEAQEKVARKSALPRLGVGLEYMYLDDFSMNGMEYEGMQMFMPMLSVSLPIFTKKYKSAKKEATLLQVSSQLAWEEQHQQLKAEFTESKQNISVYQSQLDLLKFKVNKTEKIMEITYNKFENALGSLDELLNVQRRLLNFEQEQLQVMTNLSIAKSKLNYLTYTAEE